MKSKKANTHFRQLRVLLFRFGFMRYRGKTVKKPFRSESSTVLGFAGTHKLEWNSYLQSRSEQLCDAFMAFGI